MQDPDPERNRKLVAERLGWPDGALATCRRLEEEYPGWRLHYVMGGFTMEPQAGFRASLDRWKSGRPERLFARTEEEMSEMLHVRR